MSIIYFIQVEKENVFKVGITGNFDDLPRRLSTLQTGNHKQLLIFGFVRVDYSVHRKTEKQLHDFLDDKRIRGEWFAISREDVLRIAKPLVWVFVTTGKKQLGGISAMKSNTATKTRPKPTPTILLPSTKSSPLDLAQKMADIDRKTIERLSRLVSLAQADNSALRVDLAAMRERLAVVEAKCALLSGILAGQDEALMEWGMRWEVGE